MTIAIARLSTRGDTTVTDPLRSGFGVQRSSRNGVNVHRLQVSNVPARTITQRLAAYPTYSYPYLAAIVLLLVAGVQQRVLEFNTVMVPSCWQFLSRSKRSGFVPCPFMCHQCMLPFCCSGHSDNPQYTI